MGRKPRQHLIIGGIDVFDAYGAVMTDEYELGVPEPYEVYVDVPFGMPIDMTESVTGDVSYGMRTMKFKLLVPTSSFWDVYREFKKVFHGREFDFQVKGIDSEGTFHGRFKVVEKLGKSKYGTIDLEVTARPYRVVGTRTVEADCQGGAVVELSAGRFGVCPNVTVFRESEIVFDGRSATVPAGTWQVPDMWVGAEPARVGVNTSPEDMGDVAIETLGTCSSLGGTTVWDASRSSRDVDGRYRAVFTYEVKEL